MRSLAIVMLCALTSCTSAQISSATTAAADAAAFVADLSTAFDSAVTSGTVPTSTLTAAQTALTQLCADAAALGSSSTTTTTQTVLSDAKSFIGLVGPYVPEIEALLAVAGPQSTPGVMPTQLQTYRGCLMNVKIRIDAWRDADPVAD